MNWKTFIELILLFLLFKSNIKSFRTLTTELNHSGITMFLSTSNISIIIETDSFDYQTFERIWAPILLDINLNLKSVYFYVHKRNKFAPIKQEPRNNQTLKHAKEQKAELEKLANIPWPRIVISDLPDNGNLPLMISSYTDDMYQLQVICYIDARNLDPQKDNYRKHIADLIYSRPNIYRKHRLTEWIEKSYQMHLTDRGLASVFGYMTKTTMQNGFLPQNFNSKGQMNPPNQFIEKVVGCDILMTKETVIRELLYYTKSSMDSPSPFLTLSLINDLKVHNSFDNLLSNEPIQNVDFYPFSKPKNKTHQIRPNEVFKCPNVYNNYLKKVTFSVFIPCYKRNYFNLIFNQMNVQTLQPSYYVLVQNRFKVFLDYESELRYYFRTNPRPIYKVWMLNYNSFFVLPNLVTSLLNTDLVIRFDDDHIPTDPHMLSHVVKTEFLESHNGDVIMGDRSSILNIYIGNFTNSNKMTIDCKLCQPDYVASPYIYRPHQMKLSGRLKPYFLAGGEDAHFGLSAAILCGTVSKHIAFRIHDYSADENRHEIDPEIIKYKMKYLRYEGELIHTVYEYYVKIGLWPNCWKNFVLDPSEKINDSVYHHTSYF